MINEQNTPERESFFISQIDKAQERMYCGPTILALLTGKSRAEIHGDVNRLRRKAGKKRNKWSDKLRCWKRVAWPLTAPVKGMSNGNLEKLMDKYRLKSERRNTDYPSLRRFFDDVGHLKMPIVVNVTGHYVLYFRGKVYDTLRPMGEDLAMHPCAGRRVKKYWVIRKQNAIVAKAENNDAKAA